jgi:hypothetical protein
MTFAARAGADQLTRARRLARKVLAPLPLEMKEPFLGQERWQRDAQGNGDLTKLAEIDGDLARLDIRELGLGNPHLSGDFAERLPFGLARATDPLANAKPFIVNQMRAENGHLRMGSGSTGFCENRF